VTLWIDGKRVPCKKTLASKFTNFLGWPLGQGLHAEFTFRVQHATGNEEGTKVIEEDRRGGKRSVFDDLDNKHKGKLGSIIVEFYETEEFVREKPTQPRKPRQEEDSLPEVSETNNKLMGYRVGKGKEFRTSELIGDRKDRRGNKSRGEFDRFERKRD